MVHSVERKVKNRGDLWRIFPNRKRNIRVIGRKGDRQRRHMETYALYIPSPCSLLIHAHNDTIQSKKIRRILFDRQWLFPVQNSTFPLCCLLEPCLFDGMYMPEAGLISLFLASFVSPCTAPTSAVQCWPETARRASRFRGTPRMVSGLHGRLFACSCAILARSHHI